MQLCVHYALSLVFKALCTLLLCRTTDARQDAHLVIAQVFGKWPEYSEMCAPFYMAFKKNTKELWGREGAQLNKVARQDLHKGGSCSNHAS